MAEIITVVGSGGKTSCIFSLAEELGCTGKKVLITTTTHMAAEAPFPVTDRGETCLHLLKEHPAVLLARTIQDRGTEKLSAPDEQELCACLPHVDVILNEGDGSAGKPLKVPADHEPVLLEGTDRILLLAGLSGLYRPIGEVCHRIPLVCACLGKNPDEQIREEDMIRLLTEGYLRKLEERYSGIPVELILNQADTQELWQAGLRIRSRIMVPVQVRAFRNEKNKQFIQNVLASYRHK
ncbi:MAG: putative selenium-dependent hydroxylase accessory protein YqeC [Clostridiales bacterium]|nr:putative selenium-dependent hydroxylase accessory protein YqeC [Clostridiales bacterium]